MNKRNQTSTFTPRKRLPGEAWGRREMLCASVIVLIAKSIFFSLLKSYPFKISIYKHKDYIKGK